MYELAIDAVAVVTAITLLLYVLVIAIQGTALVAQSVVDRKIPSKIYFSDVCQNLGVAVPIAGFLAGSVDVMVVGVLLLAIGVLTGEVRYRANRVVDLSLSVAAILTIGSLSFATTIV